MCSHIKTFYTHCVAHMDSLDVRRSQDGSMSLMWLWFSTQRAVRESIYNDVHLTGVILKFKNYPQFISVFYPSSLD